MSEGLCGSPGAVAKALRERPPETQSPLGPFLPITAAAPTSRPADHALHDEPARVSQIAQVGPHPDASKELLARGARERVFRAETTSSNCSSRCTRDLSAWKMACEPPAHVTDILFRHMAAYRTN